METRALVFRNWDDLVFDNRNQAYGAYLIRKAYTRRLLLSFGVSVGMAALVLLLPTLLREEAKVAMPPIDLIGIINLTDPPIFIPRPQQPAARPPVQSQTSTSTAVQVVPNDVAPPSETPSYIPSDPNGIVGSTGSDNSVTTGTSIPVEVPVVSSEPVVFAEVMPAYEDGMEGIMKFIKKKLRYPGSARRMGIDGTVYVSFVVNGDGSVSQVKVLRGIHRECDEEAARVISMLPGWKGGKQGGNPVAVRMVLPIKFSLQ